MTFPDLAAPNDFGGWRAARAPHAVAPGPDQESLRLAYLGLLKLALCDLTGTSTGSVSRRIDGSIASRELRGEDRRLRAGGIDWPLHGLTMVGLNRLDDLQACVEVGGTRRRRGRPDRGRTWRGGAAILMRATLDSARRDRPHRPRRRLVHGVPGRRRDSRDLNANDFLAVPADEVLDSFARLGLDHGVEIVEGFFEQTLPALETERWAVLRLDGDTYAATRAGARRALSAAGGRRLSRSSTTTTP